MHLSFILILFLFFNSIHLYGKENSHGGGTASPTSDSHGKEEGKKEKWIPTRHITFPPITKEEGKSARKDKSKAEHKKEKLQIDQKDKLFVVLGTWSSLSEQVLERLKATETEPTQLIFCHDSEETIKNWNQRQKNTYPSVLADDAFFEALKPTIPSLWIVDGKNIVLEQLDIKALDNLLETFIKRYRLWSEF